MTAADALAAVVVERERFLALQDAPLVDDVEQVEELFSQDRDQHHQEGELRHHIPAHSGQEAGCDGGSGA